MILKLILIAYFEIKNLNKIKFSLLIHYVVILNNKKFFINFPIK